MSEEVHVTFCTLYHKYQLIDSQHGDETLVLTKIEGQHSLQSGIVTSDRIF
jgi:hypothetical protein